MIAIEVKIYCDGAALNNGKPTAVAAWAAVLVAEDNGNVVGTKEAKGLCNPVCSTNNYAEITAALEGLRLIKPDKRDVPVTVYSDSQYLVNIASGFWSDSGNSAANTKQFLLLAKECESFNFQPEFRWIKGHDGNKHNETADRLAETTAEEYAKQHGIAWTVYPRKGK